MRTSSEYTQPAAARSASRSSQWRRQPFTGPATVFSVLQFVPSTLQSTVSLPPLVNSSAQKSSTTPDCPDKSTCSTARCQLLLLHPRYGADRSRP
ncbi:MAG: hypothetical protein BWY91_02946 [bacterium ADurb.BinA028]|nr:MAG: hypothetical protein BWY91_02946 [bacterium ADurb.BinA028]